MEALILLIGELLLAPLLLGVSLAAEFTVLGIGLFARLGARLFGSPKRGNPPHRAALRSTTLRWIYGVVGGLIVSTFIFLLAINLFFLPNAIRWLADRIESKHGFAIEYVFMEGNCFTGRFAFADVTAERDQPGGDFIHAQAESMTVNLSLLHFLTGNRTLDAAIVEGARIQYSNRSPAPNPIEGEANALIDVKKFVRGDGEEGVAIAVNLERRPKLPRWSIQWLSLTRVAIDVVDESAAVPIRYPILIERVEAAPLRSHYLWFDVLFRSNVIAHIDGAETRIENSMTSDGMRQTRWGVEGIAAETLASVVGGPFALFRSGTIDVTVSDEWTLRDRDRLQMDWLVKANEATAIVPAGTPQLLAPIAQIAINNINRSPTPWEFGFQLELSEARFKGAATLNAQQIWSEALPIVLQELSKLFGPAPAEIREKAKGAFDRFKRYLEERRDQDSD